MGSTVTHENIKNLWLYEKTGNVYTDLFALNSFVLKLLSICQHIFFIYFIYDASKLSFCTF